jgi:U3 small nucleolar ribonucleoprotein component
MNPVRKHSRPDDQKHEEAEEGVLSTHEKRQLRLAREIEKVEEQLMADKTWQFRGEATAKQRPKDSALELDLVCISMLTCNLCLSVRYPGLSHLVHF